MNLIKLLLTPDGKGRIEKANTLKTLRPDLTEEIDTFLKNNP